jgi:hypothetical protein
MADCTHFRFDLPVPGGGAAASARFGTDELSGLSGFETVNAHRGYRRGSERKSKKLTRANDVSN